MRFILLLATVLAFSPAYGHELTPAYPILTPSYVEKVSTTTVSLFNRRKDVTYYEIEVFDSNWNSIPFATESNIVVVPYQRTKKIEIYIHNKDIRKATYICTTSKLEKKDIQYTGITSRICSKIKSDSSL